MKRFLKALALAMAYAITNDRHVLEALIDLSYDQIS